MALEQWYSMAGLAMAGASVIRQYPIPTTPAPLLSHKDYLYHIIHGNLYPIISELLYPPPEGVGLGLFPCLFHVPLGLL